MMPEEANIESSMIPAVSTAENVQVDIKAQGLNPNGKLSSRVMTITAPLMVADPRVDPGSESFEKHSERSKEYIYNKGESIG
jgi:hypothetical protein